MLDIYIVGYPRSGNTWLGHLLSDVLGCAYASSADTTEFMGDVTTAPYLVYKSHASHTPDTARTILLYRDPRDVAVSVAHYLEGGSLIKAIYAMTQPIKLWGVGSYQDFMRSWWYLHRAEAEICYSELHYTPLESIKEIIQIVAGITPTDTAIETALDRQSLPNLQKKYNSNGFRNGIVGEWKTAFNYETAELFNDLFGYLLRDQGFAPDGLWVERFR